MNDVATLYPATSPPAPSADAALETSAAVGTTASSPAPALASLPSHDASAVADEASDEVIDEAVGAGSADAGLVDEREQARSVWLASTATGEPLTGMELAERFGRSERWGRARIAEARDGSGKAGPASGRGGTAARRRAATARQGTPARAGSPAETRKLSGRDGDRRDVNKMRPDSCGTDDQPVDVVAARHVPEVPVAGLPGGARLVAWAGFLFGTVISVAANVMHAWLPPQGAEPDWAPGLAPQVGAAVWPIALVISVEVLSRVRWRPGWAWQVARYGGAGVVAVGAALISYGHLHGVLEAWGYDKVGAAVGPLVVDGLMTISGFALLALSGNRHGDDGDNR